MSDTNSNDEDNAVPIESAEVDVTSSLLGHPQFSHRKRSAPDDVDGEAERSRGHSEEKTYSTITTYAISINYIIGTGVFGLPFAFYSSGLVLGVLCLSLSAFLCLLCLRWVLESLARAEGITAAHTRGVQGERLPIHRITFRKFDFTALFDMFAGWKGKAICQLTVDCYCYGALWAYCAVFSSSVASLFFQFGLNKTCDIYDHPSAYCNLTYYICLLIYAVITITFACRDMAEQATVQLIMTCYRFFAFEVMLLTVVIAMFHPNPHSPGKFSELPTVDWTGFGIMVTSGAVALNLHYNIPDIVKPSRNKRNLVTITSLAQITAFLFYVFIGVLCAAYFQKDTSPLVTLNWQEYTGRGGGWGGSTSDRPWYAIMVQLFVMLFPVFDMLTVFPLVAITLGDNIYAALPLSLKDRFAGEVLRKRLVIICRLVASVPPVVAAAALGKLDKIFSFVGLFGFLLELIFPGLLHLLSSRYCWNLWGAGSEKTPYSHPVFSKFYLVYITLFFGSTALLLAILNFITPKLFEKF